MTFIPAVHNFNAIQPHIPANTYLLKTAIATISSFDTSLEANILFDEGAQRSEEMGTKLNLQPSNKEHFVVSIWVNFSIQEPTCGYHLITGSRWGKGTYFSSDCSQDSTIAAEFVTHITPKHSVFKRTPTGSLCNR